MSKRRKKISRSPAASEPARSFAEEASQTLTADRQLLWRDVLVCACLLAMVWLAFGQTLHEGFVNFDDDRCVYGNPAIVQGISLKGVGWAFTHVVNDNWHPLTTLSHMLDCRLYGLWPGGHHLTSVMLHAATALVLFLALRKATGKFWSSAFVAAIFAVHPLRVESVAWVAERKDVLSGLFFMLTLWAYVGHARKHEPDGSKRWSFLSSPHYWLALLFFALGLLSKPMLVTLPFVLLLLDYWPLNRLNPGNQGGGARDVASSTNAAALPLFARNERGEGRGEEQVPSDTHKNPLSPLLRRGARESHLGKSWQGQNAFSYARLAWLVWEKIPFLLLSLGACVATLLAQRDAALSLQKLNFVTRLGNALMAYVAYLQQMFWPADLAAFYPLNVSDVSFAMVGLCAMILAGVSVVCVLARKERLYLLTGWLWYLGMLVPVIGLIQVGGQARADRYTYLPQIGVYILVTWAVTEFFKGSRWQRMFLKTAGIGMVAVLLLIARNQTQYWRDSIALWQHALDCTTDNAFARNNLGLALAESGKLPEAVENFDRALQLNQDYVEVRNNLGVALVLQGRVNEAVEQYHRALALRPDDCKTLYNLANAFADQGRRSEAIPLYQAALRLKPDYAEAQYNFGNVLAEEGRLDEAVPHLREAVELRPDNAVAHNNLANALTRLGRLDEAVASYHKALQLQPNYAEAYNNLANALTRQGRFDEAVAQYQKALQLRPDAIEVLYNLSNALAKQGKLAAAIEALQKALSVTTAQNKEALSEAIRKQISAYEAAMTKAQKE